MAGGTGRSVAGAPVGWEELRAAPHQRPAHPLLQILADDDVLDDGAEVGSSRCGLARRLRGRPRR